MIPPLPIESFAAAPTRLLPLPTVPVRPLAPLTPCDRAGIASEVGREHEEIIVSEGLDAAAADLVAARGANEAVVAADEAADGRRPCYPT